MWEKSSETGPHPSGLFLHPTPPLEQPPTCIQMSDVNEMANQQEQFIAGFPYVCLLQAVDGLKGRLTINGGNKDLAARGGKKKKREIKSQIAAEA